MVYFGGFFAKLGYFAGFSLHIINLTVRISAAMVVGDIRVPHTLQRCDGWSEGRGILHIKASLVQWKDIRLCTVEKNKKIYEEKNKKIIKQKKVRTYGRTGILYILILTPNGSKKAPSKNSPEWRICVYH